MRAWKLPTVPHGDYSCGIGFDHTYRVATETQIKMFDELFWGIQKMVEQAYRNGLERGQNLLGQLASGQLTVQQLNQKAVAGTEDED